MQRSLSYRATWRRAGWLRAGVLAVACMLTPGIAAAQYQPSLLSPPGATPPTFSPGIGSPGATILEPGPGNAPVSTPTSRNFSPTVLLPKATAGQVPLALVARYGADQPVINAGLTWRIYADKPDDAGNFKLVKEDHSATPSFVLPTGGYVVNVSMGLASETRAVQLRGEGVREVFDLPSGGLRVEGRVGDTRIPKAQISFDIIKGSQFEPGDKRPLAQGVATGDVVVLPAGTYNIVSNYGDANAVVRSDIRVQPGKLTDVTVNHRAAIVTFKLVSQTGGEALANTAWSVMTPAGDVIKESIGAFPRYILAEGDYRAIARNEGKVFERGFKVVAGVDGEIEVLAR